MGRYYCNKKDTVEDCRSVSIAFLKEHDYFCGGRSGGIVWRNYLGEEVSSISIYVSTLHGDNFIRFQYTNTNRWSGEETHHDYKVCLTTTPCHFGGARYWFNCPLCGRRVGKLYIGAGHKRFGCRHCYDLSYESRNQSHDGLGVLGKIIDIDKRAEKINSKTKRWIYDGRLTRKARRICTLRQQIDAYYGVAQKMGFLGNGG